MGLAAGMIPKGTESRKLSHRIATGSGVAFG
jgi:hypothetical protein